MEIEDCPFCGFAGSYETSANWNGAYCTNQECFMHKPEQPTVLQWNHRYAGGGKASIASVSESQAPTPAPNNVQSDQYKGHFEKWIQEKIPKAGAVIWVIAEEAYKDAWNTCYAGEGKRVSSSAVCTPASQESCGSNPQPPTTDQPVDSPMELLKLLGYINAMIGYCQSLKVGTVINYEYMKRMNDHYIPNTRKACMLIAGLLDNAQAPERESVNLILADMRRRDWDCEIGTNCHGTTVVFTHPSGRWSHKESLDGEDCFEEAVRTAARQALARADDQ